MPAEQSDTIVGAQVELTGSLKNSGPIHIFGKVTGDIQSDNLIVIGETAVIKGPIVAKQVDVSGKVVGSITASEMVELQAKSVVKGDIITTRLSVKPGSTFNGKCAMSTGVADQHENIENQEEIGQTERRKPRLEIE